MKILVLNGSPKGEYSITLKTVEYIEKHNPDHEFRVLNVGKNIKRFQKDFSEAVIALEEAEMILFTFPVYTFLAPSQLHIFIRLMKESKAEISGKWASVITTSKHFYDITAHNYIKENCMDMGLKFVNGLSADMDDLLHEKGRHEALAFFDHLIWSVQNDMYEKDCIDRKAPAHRPVSMAYGVPKEDKRCVIVADLDPADAQLSAMIDRFDAVFPYKTDLVNIRDFNFRGGCISCFNCSVSGECIYKDGFEELLRDNIQSSDAIVLAFSITDHSMGTQFKTYDDRQFCNGHRTVTSGTPFGYLISGNYSCESNLKMLIEARAECGGNYLAGTATDEFDPDNEIDKMAKELAYAMEKKYTQPANFYGVGGMKIFRDLIYLMQGLMKADHKYYKAAGIYDFPQKKKGTILAMYLVGALMGNKKLKAKAGNKMNEGMIAPYVKALEK